MRAHEPKKTARASGVSGALLHIKARLWWLQGFPRGSQWISVPRTGHRGTETLAIDSTLIRRAAFGLRKLEGEFPRALPRLVPDGPAWIAGVKVTLEALKEVVHRGARPAAHLLGRGLFSRTSEKDVGQLPAAMKTIARRLSWVYATRPGDFARAVRWLGNATPTTSDMVQTIQACHLAVDHGARVEGLVRLLAEKRALVPTRCASPLEPALGALKRGETPAKLRPLKATGKEAIDNLLTTLMTLDKKRQRRVLRLCSAINIGDRLARWEQFWQRASREIERGIGIGKAATDLKDRVERLHGVHGVLKELRWSHPAPVRLKLVFDSVLRLSEHEGLTRAAIKLAVAGKGDGCSSIHHAGLLVPMVTANRRDRVADFLRRLAAFFAHHAQPPKRLASWRTKMETQLNQDEIWGTLLNGETLEPEFPSGGLARVFDALDALAGEPKPADIELIGDRVAQVFGVVRQLDRGIAMAKVLLSREHRNTNVQDDVLKAADLLGGPESFGLVIPALIRIKADADELELTPLAEALLDAFSGSVDVLHAVLVGGDVSGLLEVGRRLAILAKLKVKTDLRLVRTETPSWIETAPPSLAEPLAMLALSRDDAESIAERIISKAIPGPDSLRSEADAISTQLESRSIDSVSRERLVTRLCNLQQRIESPTPPTEKTLVKLQRKLGRRAASELLVMALAKTESITKKTLAQLIGVETVPSWALEPSAQRVLAAVLDLETGTRKLALRLFRVRCGPAPWDLRDARANKQFIAALEARGLNTKPWLDGLGSKRTKNIALCLEDDPLEIFLMGSHFGTCLSVGSMNFFSVFANAADINKRVLFARDEHGNVVGRRLVCLSSEGQLVAFRTYAHNSFDVIDRAIGAFIAELAGKMGASLAKHASIPTLVARQWYDDGATNIAEQFDFLKPGSEFREALLSVSPDELGSLVIAHTGTRSLNAVLAAHLAELPEIKKRLELVSPLVTMVNDPRSLPFAEAITFAELLVRADESERAASFFATSIESHVISLQRRQDYIPQNAIEFLAHVAPSRALRILRRKERRIRQDEGLPKYLLVTKGDCLLALRRSKQARRIYEELLGWSLIDDQLRERVQRKLDSMSP